MRNFFVMLVLFGALVGISNAFDMGNTIEVNIGAEINRSWSDIIANNYLYSPRQTYSGATDATKIWLPYGDINGTYFSASNVGFTNPSGGSYGMCKANSGGADSTLVYKFHFDAPVTQFIFDDGYSFRSLGEGSEFMTQYSVDGENWATMAIDDTAGDSYGSLTVNFASPMIETQDIYIRLLLTGTSSRFYWMRTTGAPAWGQAGFEGELWTLSVVSPSGDCRNVLYNGLGMDSDVNKDCIVDLLDLASIAANWMDCNNPQGDADCQSAWD